MADPIDYFEQFLGVDIAKVEMITELIGAVQAALLKSMIRHGPAEKLALQVVKDAHSVLFRESVAMARQPPKENHGAMSIDLQKLRPYEVGEKIALTGLDGTVRFYEVTYRTPTDAGYTYDVKPVEN